MPVTSAPFSNVPIRIPWDEVGNNVGDFYNQAAVQVRDFLCGLHQKDPSGLTGDCQILDNPLCRIAHSNWDRACQGGQSTPVPLPFEGGQCEVPYRVALAVNTYIPGRCNQTNPNGVIATRILQGPLQGWNFFEGQNQPVEGNCFGSPEVVQSVSADFLGNGDLWPVFRNFHSTNSNFFDGRYCQLLSFSIERVDGLPDDCGSGGDKYSPSTPLTDADKTTTITINNIDGTSFDFDLTLTEISVEAIFNFNLFIGDINNPDGGGMGVTVDHNGITFDPSGAGSIAPADIKDSQDSCKPKKPTLPELEEEEGEEEEDDEEIEYVKITLTKFPDRVSFGESIDANNYFAGFFKWNIGGEGYTPPQYIMNRDNIFEAPENAKGYVVSFRYGAQGIVKKLKLKQETTEE